MSLQDPARLLAAAVPCRTSDLALRPPASAGPTTGLRRRGAAHRALASRLPCVRPIVQSPRLSHDGTDPPLYFSVTVMAGPGYCSLSLSWTFWM